MSGLSVSCSLRSLSLTPSSMEGCSSTLWYGVLATFSYVRTYEKVAKTPYQRVLEHPSIDEGVKERLRKEHETLNPLILKREMDKRLTIVNNQQTRHDHRNCGCSFR